MASTRGRPPQVGGRRGLSVFLAVPLLVLVVVGAGTALLSERLARANAIEEAQQTANRMTSYLIAPVLKEAVEGIAGRWEDLDSRVQNRLADGSITTVLVWQPPHDIVYSSRPTTVGRVVAPTTELRAALSGRIVSEVDDHPGKLFPEGSTGPLVEVYVPVLVDGVAMVVVTHFGYDSVLHEAALLRGQIIPLAVGALVVLQLVQVPIGVSLFRRVRRQDAERAELLARSLAASDRERRAIAADVHDGPVQELAGVAYALGALRPSAPASAQPGLDRLLVAAREAVAWLRRLMIDVYPPDLGPAAMSTALADVADSIRTPALAVDVETWPVPGLTSTDAAVLYRTAKEALTLAADRSTVTRVRIWFGPATYRGRPAAQLDVCDDGVASPAERADDALRLVRRQIAELGGVLTRTERTDRDTVVTALVPTGDDHPEQGGEVPLSGGWWSRALARRTIA